MVVIQFTPDVTAPSVPGQPTQTGVTTTTASFNWTASADTQSGVAGYDVERNGSIIATSATVTTNSYTDTGLTPGGTYTYRVRARDVAGLASGFSASRAITTSGGAGTADWIARSSAAGVTMASNFNVATEVTNYIHSNPAAYSWDTAERLSGAGSLRMFVPASADENTGSWKRAMNDAWSASPSNNNGWGTQEFYYQYRIKCGPNWHRPSNGGGGSKTLIMSGQIFTNPIASQSSLPFEIVHNNRGYRGVISSYHQDGIGFAEHDESIGPDLRLQPMVDWGAGVPNRNRYATYEGGGYTGVSPGSIRWPIGEWITLYQRTRIQTYGGTTGNEMDMWYAGPTDSTYIQLYSVRNFLIGPRIFPLDSDPNAYAGGLSTVWHTLFDTARVNANHDKWAWIGEMIASSQPIACPTPLIAPPTHITTQVAKTWKQPATNVIENVASATTAAKAASGMFAYSGGCDVNQATKEILVGPGGGHADYDGNGHYGLPLANASPAWRQVRSHSVSSNRSDFTCTYADGQPRSPHSFDSCVWVPGINKYFLCQFAGLWEDGQNGGRVFEFNETTGLWIARAYQPGAGPSTGVIDDKTNGVSRYDPYTGLIWNMPCVDPPWTFDPVSFATVQKGPNRHALNFVVTGCLAPEHRCFVIYKPSTGAIRTYNLDTDTYSTPTISGTGPTQTAAGMRWHSPSDAFLAWGHSTNRQNLYMFAPPVPFTFGGTWTWTQVTPDASNTITPPNIGTYGDARDRIHGRVALVKDLGGTRVDALSVVLRTDGPASIYRLKPGGMR
jgi:chitodextrinase